MSTLKMSLAPFPVPKGSRLTPTMPGECAPVRIECGGGIVGFHLADEMVVFVEFDHPRIVIEDGDTPVPVSEGGPYFLGHPLDTGLKETVNGLPFSILF